MRLDDEIVMLKGLSKTLSRDVGLYVELKRPAWHREQDAGRYGQAATGDFIKEWL